MQKVLIISGIKIFIYTLPALICALVSSGLFAQNPERDSVRKEFQLSDTLDFTMESTDTSMTDSIERNYLLSEDALEEVVTKTARDSAYLDKENEVYHLYGNAKLEYEGIQITAGHIAIYFKENIALAKGHPDSSGNMSAFPYVNVDGESFYAKEIKYNFKTQKGIVKDSYRKESDIHIRGKRAKVINQDPADTSSNMKAYLQQGLITSCNHPVPHYSIRSSKQKLIMDEIAVVGPSNLEFNGVPTPLWLPFGFFPMTNTKKTGLLFPKNYTDDNQLGFGLKGVGYYFPINDYLDAAVTADIYLRGSFALHLNSQYAMRYKYRGNFNLSYSNIRAEQIQNKRVVNVREQSFSLRVSHNQDSKAHPTRSFGGSINIQTNGFKELNSNSVDAQLNPQLSSNFNLTKVFPDANLTLSTGLTHSQNTRTHSFDLSFPNVKLQMNQIMYPFKRKIKPAKERWYEKITFRYSAEFKNSIQTLDTLLFEEETYENMQFGLAQKANSNINFNLFKYINVSPSVNYNETWYWKTTRKELQDTLLIAYDSIPNPDFPNKPTIVADTLQHGLVNTEQEWGFTPLRQFSASLNMNTALYGTIKFKKGFLRGLRHTVKPNLSLSYSPDYLREELGYYMYHDSDLRAEENKRVRYSIFENSNLSKPSAQSQQLSVNMSINNAFSAKIYQAKKEKEKNIDLIPRLNVSSRYVLTADSFKLSDLQFNGSFRLLKRFTNVSFNGRFSPYVRDNTGRLHDQYLWEAEKKLARFEYFRATGTSGFRLGEFFDLLKNDQNDPKSKKKSTGSLRPNSLRGIIDNFQVNHSIVLTYDKLRVEDKFYIAAHDITVKGNIPITKHWNINIQRLGYSFSQNRITYPALGISRDLHCWEFIMLWYPERESYNFTLGVKRGVFDFLSVPYRKNTTNLQVQF